MAVLRYFHLDPKQLAVKESSVVDNRGTTLTNKLTTINTSISNNTQAIDDKQDTIPGKSLSSNDFTNYYKDKLDHIEAKAEVNVLADWDESDSTADSYIQNKPGIDTVVTLDSDNLITSGAVFTAIDNLPEPMIFKGSLGVGGTILSLPSASSSNIGYTYKVITDGTYAGLAAKGGDVYISDGTDWIYIPSADEPSGTVTNVSMTVPTGLEVSGSPITTSGTLAITYALGYAIPTLTDQAAWTAKQDAISDLATIRSRADEGHTAYGWGNHASAGYAYASALSGYLPLTGGTLTGRLNVNESTGDSISITSSQTWACALYHANAGDIWAVGANTSNLFYFYNGYRGAIVSYFERDGNLVCGGVSASGTSNRLIFRHLDGLNCNGDYNLYLLYHNTNSRTYFNGGTYYIQGGTYNGTASNADTVDGYHAGDFIRNLGGDGGSISGFYNTAAGNQAYYWGFNGGGSNTYAVHYTNVQVGYASSAGSAGKLTSLGNYVYSNLSTDIPTDAVSYKIITSGGDVLGDSQYEVLHLPWNSGDWGNYLIFGANNGRFGVKYKHGGAVREVLDSSNYSSYALPLSGGTMTGNISFSNSGTGFRGINYGTMGDNDQWRIGGAATGSNAGYMEIATADDGTEPIYVRLYTGVFSTLTRTLILLDESGNTYLPGVLTMPNLAMATNYSDVWSDGTHSHPWYGYDHRYQNTGIYSTTISDYFGMTLKTGSGYLVMTNGGNVGIGTTNPKGKLHVSGGIMSYGNGGFSGCEFYHKTNHVGFTVDPDIPNSYGEIGSGSDYFILNANTNYPQVTLAYPNGGAFYVGPFGLTNKGCFNSNGVWVGPSDISLKRDIHKIEPYKSKYLYDWMVVEGIKEFTWKDRDVLSVGVIAQEVLDAAEDVVDRNEYDNVLYVDYTKLHSRMIAAIVQELEDTKEEIKLLRALIAELKLLQK